MMNNRIRALYAPCRGFCGTAVSEEDIICLYVGEAIRFVINCGGGFVNHVTSLADNSVSFLILDDLHTQQPGDLFPPDTPMGQLFCLEVANQKPQQISPADFQCRNAAQCQPCQVFSAARYRQPVRMRDSTQVDEEKLRGLIRMWPGQVRFSRFGADLPLENPG